jgi:2-polyprenyl-3-methyl-5-hydroxy-6-metoxy-1,4-benzoquinol methylase
MPATEEWLAGLSRCSRCGLAFGVGPEPEHVRSLYRGNTYLETYRGGAVEDAPEPFREQEARVRVGMLRRFKPPGRLLEVGAAGGHFLAQARSAGYEVLGIEPTDNGAEAARRRFSVDVLHGFVEDVELPPQSFDAVCGFHVLEHIPEPLATLEHVRGWMRPGAILLLEVPNASSRPALRQGADWSHLDLAHHVAQYTPRALTTLLERAGLTVELTQSVAYTVYRPSNSPMKWVSAARAFTRAGGLPWRPHPWRFELLQGVARLL